MSRFAWGMRAGEREHSRRAVSAEMKMALPHVDAPLKMASPATAAVPGSGAVGWRLTV